MPPSHAKRLNWEWVAAFFVVAAFWIGGWLWMERHNSALLKAINAGDVHSARQAFKDGAMMRMHIRRDFTFLQVAARHGSVEMAKFLVENGAAATLAATNQDGETALDIAVANGHAEMAEYLRSLATKQ